MKPILAALLMLPLDSLAGTQPDDAHEFTRAASEIAAPDWVRVVSKKTAGGVDDVGMLIPARLCFAPSGTLSEKGRRLLEQAEGYTKQTNKKLYMQIPGASTEIELLEIARTSPTGYIRRNALVGSHVYLTIKD